MGICLGTTRAYRLANARCRVAQTVHRTVCYCSLFDSHPYNKKREAVPEGTTSLFGAGDGNRTHTTSLEGWDSSH